MDSVKFDLKQVLIIKLNLLKSVLKNNIFLLFLWKLIEIVIWRFINQCLTAVAVGVVVCATTGTAVGATVGWRTVAAVWDLVWSEVTVGVIFGTTVEIKTGLTFVDGAVWAATLDLGTDTV
jgi:hypothetical protein